MKKKVLLTLTMLLLTVLGAMADEQGNYYKYNPDNYQARTQVFVTFVNASGTVVDEDSWYVGAFIGGECRYEGTMERVASSEGTITTFFRLEVGGEDGTMGTSENGQAITLKVYKPLMVAEGGYEYLIEGTSFTFQGDYTYGEASNPIQVTFDPLTRITMNNNGYALIHRNVPTSILSFVYNPSSQTLPAIEWTLPETEDLELTGTSLVGKNINLEGIPVTWKCGGNEGTLTVVIDAPAIDFIWADQYFLGPLQGQLTIPIGDNTTLQTVLTEGYTLDPKDATTEFPLWNWSSSDQAVIENLQGEFDVKTKGTAVLTGYATDSCQLAPTLTVKVEQPVTSITPTYTDVYAIVGSDLTALLNRISSTATVLPDEADNKTLKWGAPDGEYIVLENNKYKAAKVTPERPATLTLEPADGYEGFCRPVIIYINIIEQPVQSIAPVKNPLHLSYAGESYYVEDQLYNNIKVTPNTYTAQDLRNNQQLWLSVQGDDVAGTTGGSSVIGWGEQGLTVIGAGECTIMAQGNTQTIDENGQLQYLELSTTFVVNVSNGLQGFYFDEVYMTKDANASFTVMPNPADAEFDASKVSVQLNINSEDGYTLPENWSLLELTSLGNLQWNVKANSVGYFIVDILYDGEVMSQGGVNVRQRLSLKDGWQWIALQGGQLEGEFEEAFSDKLAEARSETEMIINDSELGYWGTLWFMNYDQTYKVKMNLGSDIRTYDVDTYDYLYAMGNTDNADWNPMERELHMGWNWVGNPYQYWQSINDIFSESSSFTEGDVVKFKTQFATYTNGAWQPAIYVEPAQGMIVYKKEAGLVTFNSEFGMQQNTSNPSAARQSSNVPQLWSIDDSRFDDNMAMVAYVGAVTDPTNITLWAFVGDECRGRGVGVGDRQFITVHGKQGERVTFKVYDNLTGELREVVGSRPFAALSGTVDAPVALYAGKILTAIDAVENSTVDSKATFDLQGRRVDNVQKGLYIQNGRKVVVR